jgi:hypothetical protein
MGGGIDALGQAADDGQAGLGEVLREGGGIAPALRRGVATADDGQHGAMQDLGPALDVQPGRCARQLVEQRRISRVGAGYEMGVRAFQPGGYHRSGRTLSALCAGSDRRACRRSDHAGWPMVRQRWPRRRPGHPAGDARHRRPALESLPGRASSERRSGWASLRDCGRCRAGRSGLATP